MPAISMVLDAANIAFESRSAGEGRFVFARVEEVRTAWQAEDPDGQVHAVIDASVRGRLVDGARAAAAEADGWLTVAAGDADDEILRLADEYHAKIVSRDNFAHSADRYPWLHQDRDRLYEVAWYAAGPRLRRRRPVLLTPEKIAEAKRRKAAKAGDPGDLGDRQWRCTGPADRCDDAGRIVPAYKVSRQGRAYYCRSCGWELEEVEVAEPVRPSGPPTVSLLHGGRVQWERQIPVEGCVLGRGSAHRPEVIDVTAGLLSDDARAISGRHMRLYPDETGLPVAVHEPATNASFLNPTLAADGLPADNRMVPGEEYPLVAGDQIALGPGLVRLVVHGAVEEM